MLPAYQGGAKPEFPSERRRGTGIGRVSVLPPSPLHREYTSGFGRWALIWFGWPHNQGCGSKNHRIVGIGRALKISWGPTPKCMWMWILTCRWCDVQPNSLAVGFDLAPLLPSVFLTMGSWTGSTCKCRKLTFRLWKTGIRKQSLQAFAYKGFLHCTEHFVLHSHWFLH